MSRRLRIFFILVGVVVVGYFVGSRLGFGSNGVSADFSDARAQGAVVGQDIVNLSNDMAKRLDKINQYDKEGDYTEALVESVELVKNAQDLRTRAISLSSDLERMTGALSSIKNADARAAALESISNRMALISRLLSYNDYYLQLLNALQTRFRGQKPTVPVQTLIDQINSEVNAINNFNRQAGEAMDRFDSILKTNGK
ncbi:MAG TPA: hypothetical protein VMC43_01300 [Candidatus Paceibacterota bacterium]|nr:hypothetical protein [Candidatus Paceibacterota bacterium]